MTAHGNVAQRPLASTAGRLPTTPQRALPAVLAVAWLLAGAKWGSYLGVPPLYVADVLLAAAVAHVLIRQLRTSRDAIQPQPTTPTPVLAWLLLGYSILRYLVGENYLDTSSTLRDFAPYLYVLVVPLAAHGLVHSTAATRARTVKIVWAALLFHTAWVPVYLFAPTVAAAMPQLAPNVIVFNARDDIDSAILAVTAALAFHRWGRGDGRRWMVLSVLCLGLVVTLTSRAGFLSLALALGLVIAALHSSGSERMRRRLLILPVAALVAAVALPNTVVGARLMATIGLTEAESQLANIHASAQGTTDARERAWSRLTDWTSEEDSRLFFGVGFGPNFMVESGAGAQLLGSELAAQDVRSPHNYYLGTTVRLGIVGGALALLLSLAAMANAWRARKSSDELHILAACLVAALIPAAALGVIFEAPFGAIPFFWAVGILHAFRRQDIGGVDDASVPGGESRARPRDRRVSGPR